MSEKKLEQRIRHMWIMLEKYFIYIHKINIQEGEKMENKLFLKK